VLKWNSRNEDKANHGKFDWLLKGPYKIEAFRGNHAFFLKDFTEEALPMGLFNDKLLKHYLPQS